MGKFFLWRKLEERLFGAPRFYEHGATCFLRSSLFYSLTNTIARFTNLSVKVKYISSCNFGNFDEVNQQISSKELEYFEYYYFLLNSQNVFKLVNFCMFDL